MSSLSSFASAKSDLTFIIPFSEKKYKYMMSKDGQIIMNYILNVITCCSLMSPVVWNSLFYGQLRAVLRYFVFTCCRLSFAVFIYRSILCWYFWAWGGYTDCKEFGKASRSRNSESSIKQSSEGPTFGGFFFCVRDTWQIQKSMYYIDRAKQAYVSACIGHAKAERRWQIQGLREGAINGRHDVF